LENITYKNYTDEDFVNTQNALIKRARGDNAEVILSEAQKNCNIQQKILSKVSNPMEIRSYLKKSYKTKYGNAGDKFLAKDLFTVYCGLSTLEENSDFDYFRRCFMYMVKNVYDNQSNIVNQKASDLAFNYSMYVNLLRSDAFLHTPLVAGREVLECFAGKSVHPLVIFSPDPTKQTLFPIDVLTPVKKPETNPQEDTTIPSEGKE